MRSGRIHTKRGCLLIILSLLLFAAASWYTSRDLLSPTPHNVIVLTVESLRDDQVTEDITPKLLTLSQEGYRFSNHRAVSGWTGTNIITLLTGLSPYESGVHTRGQSIAKDRPTPLEKMQSLDYRVEGIQGFMGMDIYKNLGLTIRPQTDNPLYWLALRKKRQEPFFLWYHFVHTHLPYSSPAGYETDVFSDLQEKRLPTQQQKRLERVRDQSAVHSKQVTFQGEDIPLVHQLQESTVREFDDWFANFWDFLKRSGLRENTILVLTADHGDEHGEHGMVGHASTTQLGHLHEEIVRIPLFIWLPPDLQKHVQDADTSFDSNHEDIMPSIFGLLGIDPEVPFSGRDLFAESKPSPWKAMTSSGGFAEEDTGNIRYFEYATMIGSHKLLLKIDKDGTESARLYDLAQDPKEQKDISAERSELVLEMINILRPIMENRTNLPVKKSETIESLTGEKPSWVYPTAGKVYGYDDMQGRFVLEWSGAKNESYIVEYQAGEGESQIAGTLEVDGNSKNFGQISRRYWQTWIIPRSPIRVRVRLAGDRLWSDWLQLEARP